MTAFETSLKGSASSDSNTMVLSNNTTIVNKILDVDLNDSEAVRNVIDTITSHPFRNAYFLSNLLVVAKQNDSYIDKFIFFHNIAYSPDDPHVYVFKNKDGLAFVVNILESRDLPCHNIPSERNGIERELGDIPIPPLNCEDIVRIDIHRDTRFTLRKMKTVNCESARGRYLNVPNINISDIMPSLYRREEGHKRFEEILIIFDDALPALPQQELFENKILNNMYQLQRRIRNIGELKTFVEGMLFYNNVCHPYEEDGANILQIQSPNGGPTFMVAVNHTMSERRDQQQSALESNINNLLTHYLPDHTFDESKRNHVLLAITYNSPNEHGFHFADSISSFKYGTESEEFKTIFKSYHKTISLKDRCRYVILKNKHLLTSHINQLPPSLLNFISSKHPLVNVSLDLS